MSCGKCGTPTVEAVAEMSGRSIVLDSLPSRTGEWLIVDKTDEETMVVQLVPPGSPGALQPHRCPREAL